MTRRPHAARRTSTSHVARRTVQHVARQHVARSTCARARARARSTCHNRSVPALLISTYDLGRQPFGLASAAAVLRAAGVDVTLPRPGQAAARSEAVAPTRRGRVLPADAHRDAAGAAGDRSGPRRRIRGAQLFAYGLYAPLNDGVAPRARRRARHRRRVRGRSGAGSVTGAAAVDDAAPAVARGAALPRVTFPGARSQRAAGALALRDAADRRRAARRRLHRGEPRLQASLPALSHRSGLRRPLPHRPDRRSCSRTSGGRWRPGRGTSPSAIPTSSTARVTRASWSSALRARVPRPHLRRHDQDRALLAHAALLPLLRDTGCLFVTSAVESIDDRVLAQLEKGHTRARLRSRWSRCAATPA